MFKNRTTGEIMVLLVAITVCGYVVIVGTSLIIFEFVHPDVEASAAFRSVASVINTLIGLLAGFLAGRTDLSRRKNGDDQ